MSLLDALGGGPLGADGLGGGGLGSDPSARECSRAGCRSGAVWAIGWRNPKIHASDRVKVWVACNEHVDFLREFLAARDFPLTVSPLAISPLDAATDGAASDPSYDADSH